MYVNDYRRLTDDQIKKIYDAYANIIEDVPNNQSIRDLITGIIFEKNNVFTFKLYRPSNLLDARLTYTPTEIVKIGKNNKTTIPVTIKNVVNIIPYEFDIIDNNVSDDNVFDNNVFDNIIFDSNI